MPSIIDIPSYLLGKEHRASFILWLSGQLLPKHTKRELAAIWAYEYDIFFTRDEWILILNKRTTFDGTSPK